MYGPKLLSVYENDLAKGSNLISYELSPPTELLLTD